jgi:acetolactate synthase-1/2/3 large subunit
MSRQGGGAIVARTLADEGVSWIFGIPGTHNIELYDAFREHPSLRPVLISDEQSAAFLADGVARATGGLAAVNLVPGAGLTHALSGITECQLDQIPLLVLACGLRSDIGKSYQLHQIDQAALLRPVCKGVFQPRTHADLSRAIREACALARRAPFGPVAVEIPANLYLLQGEAGEAPAPVPAPAPRAPAREDLERAIEVLDRAPNVAIYAGLGAQGAERELMALAERLDAVVFTTISAKGLFPETSPRWAWNVLGRAAPPAIRDVESGCDCVLAIGCRFGEVATASYGLDFTGRKLIHVDIDPAVFDRNYPADVKVEADAGAFLRALLAALESHPPRDRGRGRHLLEGLARAHAQRRDEQLGPELGEPGCVRPGRLFDALQRVLGPDAVYVTDSGNGAFQAMECLRLPAARSFLSPVDYSCMGYGVPAAIGAKLAAPSRPVAAIVGDGAFLMTGLELTTAAAYGAGVIVLLFRDRQLSQIAQFQERSLARRTNADLADYDAASIARACGAEYFLLDDEAKLGKVLAGARRAGEERIPSVVEVAIDYRQPTHFTRGIVETNFQRFDLRDRLRLAARVIGRRIAL